VVAPIGEELLFRAFLFGGLRRYLPFLPAAMISGLCFSLAHGQLGLILPFAGVGMLFAYVYERTRTIYASMSVHFLFNLVSMTVLILTKGG
jgi:membrane protease YdiL (CAAX protease family)